MAKNVLQSTILSGAGAVAIAPGAQIEVRNPSGLLVPLWLDRDGTQPTTNPTTADSDGFFRVYLDSGRYHITARSGGESREWRDVLLGSAAGYDVDDMLAALAAGIYTSVAEGLANTAEGDFFWIAHETGEDVLTLYRVVDGDAELWAALPRGDIVRELTARAEAAAESAEEDAQAAADALAAILALGDLPSAVAAAEQAAQSASDSATAAATSESIASTAATAAEQAAQRAEDAAAATGLPSPIVPDTFLQAKADGSGYEAKTAQQVADILRLIMPPRGHIAGLRVSNNAADPDNDIDIAPGEAADSTGTHLLRLTSTLTKRLDATWAEGDGEGGLDTGSKAADTTYHVHLIRKDADGTVDALFSASADSPVLPSGWSAFRRIFSVLTDADGDIRAFTQVGDRVVWREWTQDAAASFTNVASLVTVTVPQGISVEADLQLTSPGENSRYIWVSSPLMDDLEVIRFWDQSPTDGYATIRSQKRVLTNTSGQVRVRTAEGPASLGIYTIGYLDTRGRFD